MAVLAAGIVAVAALNGSAGQAQTPPAFRPNVVMIMTDDQTVESMRVMPNVKTLLADRGVTFDNSFVSYSLCCPSRATYLTGQYAHNHGVMGNAAPNGGYYKLDSTNTPVTRSRFRRAGASGTARSTRRRTASTTTRSTRTEGPLTTGRAPATIRQTSTRRRPST